MQPNARLYGAAIAAAAFCFSFGAHAQQASDKGTNASPLTKPIAPALPLPDQGTSQGYLFNLRPLGEDFGKKLADHGIYLTGRTFNEGFANVSGGIKRGSLYEGFTAFGVDLDMNRIAGIHGGSIHLLLDDLNGQPFLGYSGSAYINNKVFGGTAAARLNELSYEQSLFNDKLDVRFGRVTVGTEFDTSEIYCEFVTALCATPSGYSFTKGYPSYLTSSTAIVGQLTLPNSFYLNAGAYEDEPALAQQHHFNWPGRDWDPSLFRGVTVPVQFGYRTNYNNDPYPRSYDIGAFYDTGDYTDPLLNTAGLNRVRNGGVAKLDHGKSSVWAQAQQVVWRPDMTSKRGITVFGAANVVTSGQTNIRDTIFAGFSWAGPMESRPNDKLNFVAQYVSLNDAYTTFVDSTLQKGGVSSTVSNDESFIELNYGIALAPGIAFKPFIDVIFNPDQVGIAKPSATNTHALFVGAAFSMFFADALGLPKLSR
ncbi:carbohydrate porin [Beijerinckia sp. L45]|uniref:carbohydrate porin n=1 Tax=Beijerinckia sp. L45 TaxID=1641855 RepID=UPI00131C14D0|nr:carbohydrate porin [Beijerinckia sp. L45]